MKKSVKYLCFASALMTAGSVFAHGYLRDSSNQIVRNSYNECWRTGHWTPADAIAECDPALVKKAPEPKPEPKPMPAPKPEPKPQPETRSAPVVVPPPVAPVAKLPPPPPPKPRKINLNAGALFITGGADLSNAGKSEIDKEVVSKLGEFATIRSISITGHASPTGSARYNQQLSERRAEATKAYLVSKGIDAKLIKTRGAGQSEPLPDVNCDAKKLNRTELAACHVPLRRVEVAVDGDVQ